MDIINALREEHQRVMALFEKVESLPVSSAQPDLVEQLVRELSAHEAAEEVAVWSELRNILADVSIVDEVARQENDLNQRLSNLRPNLGLNAIKGVLHTIREQLVRHLETEEGRLFPLVTDHVDQPTRQRLAQAYVEAKGSEIKRITVTMAPEAPVTERHSR